MILVAQYALYFDLSGEFLTNIAPGKMGVIIVAVYQARVGGANLHDSLWYLAKEGKDNCGCSKALLFVVC